MGLVADTMDTDLNASLTKAKLEVTVNDDGTFNVNLMMGSTVHTALVADANAQGVADAVADFTTTIAEKRA